MKAQSFILGPFWYSVLVILKVYVRKAIAGLMILAYIQIVLLSPYAM